MDILSDMMIALDKYMTPADLGRVRDELSFILANYSVTYTGTELAEYTGGFPECYKAYMVSQKINGLSELTLKGYNYTLRDFFFNINKDISKLTANDIRAYLYQVEARRGVSKSTLEGIRTVINGFLEWCCNEEYIDRNPCRKIRPVKCPKKEREPLSHEELELLRNACETAREKALVEFYYATGCRVSEGVNAKISDIDFSNRSLIVTGKGNKQRTVYLNARAYLAIKGYIETRTDDVDSLFVTDILPCRKISVDTVQKEFKILGKRAGIVRRIHPHLLRHTVATDCLERGMAINDIQNMLGHANVSTTMIYAKTNTLHVQSEHARCVV